VQHLVQLKAPNWNYQS